MSKYVYKRTEKGIYYFDLKKQYEKIKAAARLIAAVQDPADVTTFSTRENGHRPVYKFSQVIGATAVTGRWVSGMLTNQNTRNYNEPRLLILTDPRMDFKALKESSYMNIPTIALCNTDSNLDYIDCAIPCNNRSKKSLAIIFWLLATEVKRILGKLKEDEFLDIIPDLFLQRTGNEKIDEEEENNDNEKVAEDEASEDRENFA